MKFKQKDENCKNCKFLVDFLVFKEKTNISFKYKLNKKDL